MLDKSVLARLDLLEAKVERLAAEIRGRLPEAAGAPAPEPAPRDEPAPVVPPEPAATGALEHLKHLKRGRVDWARPPAMDSPARIAPDDPAINRARIAKRTDTLEVAIGTRWVAWVGALLVVLSAAFFVKLAYDQGWLALSPLAKCLIAAGFGGTLICAGELALRRIGRAAAVSLFSAGLGVLYLNCYASFRLFGLIDEAGAFWFLLAVLLGGVALTARAGSLAVGVLTLLGGYGAPILLAGAKAGATALPLYLSALLAVTLLLVAWRPAPFAHLRTCGLVLHALIAMLWLLAGRTEDWPILLLFPAGWWLLAQASLRWSVESNGNAGVEVEREETRRVDRASRPGALGPVKHVAVVSLLATAWLVVVSIAVIQRHVPAGANLLGVFCLVLAAAVAAGVFLAGSGVAALRGAPGTPTDSESHRDYDALRWLTLSWWLQFGVLVALAIGLHFDDAGMRGSGQVIGWLALGLAAVELGRRLGSVGTQNFGIVAGALALCTLAYRAQDAELRPAWIAWDFGAFGAFALTPWLGLALLAIATTMTASFRVGVGAHRPRESLKVGLALVAVAVWLFAFAEAASGAALTFCWLAAAAGLLAAYRLAPAQAFLDIAPLVLVAAACRWVSVDAIAMASVQSGAAAWGVNVLAEPVRSGQAMGAQATTAGLLLALGTWLFRLQNRHASPLRMTQEPRDAQPERGWQTGAIVLVVAMLLAMSYEVNEKLQLAGMSRWPLHLVLMLWLTLLWGGAGTGLALAGWRRGQAELFLGGGVIASTAALVWLTGATAFPWLFVGALEGHVVLNLQFATGACLAGLLGLLCWHIRTGKREQAAGDGPASLRDGAGPSSLAAFGGALIVLIGLWLGTLEIDRCFATEHGRYIYQWAGINMEEHRFARQAGFSVFWALYALLLIGIGMVQRIAPSRQAGLALLGVTLVKLLLVDMSGFRTAYRVLSFLALGLVLIAVSVVYAKWQRRLARGDAAVSGE